MGRGRRRAVKLTLKTLRRQAREALVVGAAQARRLPHIHWRPQTRGECVQAKRPCPYLGCKYHLGLEVKRSALLLPFGEGPDFGHMRHTCALDVADEGPHTSIEVAQLMGVSRQRVSQIESEALAKVRASMPSVSQQFDSVEVTRLTESIPSAGDVPRGLHARRSRRTLVSEQDDLCEQEDSEGEEA